MDLNPAASAAELPDVGRDAERGTFYRIDYRHGTLREFWWGRPGPYAVLGWVIAKLGRSSCGSTDDPNVESLIPFEIDEESISPELRESFAQLAADLEKLGFVGPSIVHFIDDPVHRARTTMLSMAHRDGDGFARIHSRIWRQVHPVKRYLFTEFITALSNGNFLWSLSSHPDAISPSSCRLNRIEGASPQQLWESHRDSLLDLNLSAELIPVVDHEGLRRTAERHHVAIRDFHLRRRFFQPLAKADQEELARLRATRLSTVEGAEDGADEVLAEIETLQNVRANWKQGILTLIVSLVVFLAIGIGGDWESTLLLVPILLFHELGHWAAMRYFGYRNLRMFFIPMFGAAVSGRHYNVAAWKKAVVSLMGPVPGILVGAALGGVGMYLGNKSLIHVAGMMSFINGLNLLPFLPFDGGWIAHSLLFSRHWLLELLFRIATVIALAAASMFVGDYLLRALAILVAIGLFDSYRMARISYDLRRSGWRAVSDDDQTIPPDVARVIIARVKTAFPKVAPVKTIAQRTLMVFESINAKPAGWFATIALGGTQIVSLLLALLIPVTLYAGPRLLRAYRGPSDPLEISGLRIEEGSPVSPLKPRAAVVGYYLNATEASLAFERLRPAVKSATSLLLIGSSVVVSLPPQEAALAEWSERLAVGALQTARSESLDDDWLPFVVPNGSEPEPEVAVDEVASQMTDEAEEQRHHPSVTVALRCEMPTPEDAERISADVARGASLWVLPPWAFAELTDDRVERYRSARATYATINDAVEAMPNVVAARAAFDAEDEFDENLNRALLEARKEGIRSEASAWLQKPDAGDSEMVRAMLAQLDSETTDPDGGPGPEVRLPSDVRAFLGSMTEAQQDGQAQLARHAANSWAWSVDRTVNIQAFRFADLAFGAHSLLRWLSAEGCRDFRCELSARGQKDHRSSAGDADA